MTETAVQHVAVRTCDVAIALSHVRACHADGVLVTAIGARFDAHRQIARTELLSTVFGVIISVLLMIQGILVGSERVVVLYTVIPWLLVHRLIVGRVRTAYVDYTATLSRAISTISININAAIPVVERLDRDARVFYTAITAPYPWNTVSLVWPRPWPNRVWHVVQFVFPCLSLVNIGLLPFLPDRVRHWLGQPGDRVLGPF